MQLLYALGIAICLVLLWQAVAWLRSHRQRLRMKLERVPAVPLEEIERHPELGQVRVRARLEPADPVVAPEVPVVAASVIRETVRLEEPSLPEVPEEGIPMLVNDGTDDVAVAQEVSPPEAASAAEEVPVLLTLASVQPESGEQEQPDLFADELIAPPPSRRPVASGAVASTASKVSALYEKPVEPVRPVAASADDRPHVDVQDVIALHVVAADQPFNGEDLLRCVLGYGLRFGEMSIFHRHEQPTGQGRILFSMARAVEPGIFQLETMTGETIPGVSFFLSLPGVNSILAYDIMVDTVRRLATELQGEVLDQQQQVLTRQLVEHYRERVQEFERRRLMARPSA